MVNIMSKTKKKIQTTTIGLMTTKSIMMINTMMMMMTMDDANEALPRLSLSQT